MIAGRYSLDSQIGRGGMGVVWRGEDQVLGRDVALKRIGMAPGGASPDLLRAEREARLAASLNHPNVVAVFDLIVENDEHWLVMEYVPSRNLADVVREGGPLPPDSAARLIGQAADALAAAHGAGIVHRDVKPSNILVTPQGRVKLTDFGIARTSGDATLTQTGMVTGSPAYIAPEVASGKSATDASDVWSLGATLYHALAGGPPYDVKDNMVAALYRIVHEDPPRLADAGWLAPVLEATMAKDPADRWSMARLRDHLVAGPDATPTRPAPVAPDDATRTTALTAVGAGGGGVGASGSDTGAGDDTKSGPGAAGTSETPDIAPTPRPRRDRRRLAGWLVGGAAVLLAAVLVWLAIGAGDDEGVEEAGPSDPTTSASSPEESPSETETTQEEEQQEQAAPTEQELESFVSDYVSTAVSDPDTAWQQLTPAFQNQSGGRQGYDDWWDQFESAQVRDVSADPDAMTVSYTVDYVYTDGRQTTDDVTLQLVERGGELLIADEY